MRRPLEPLFSGLPDSIERLAARARAVASLTEQVRNALPEPLRAHVLSAVRREGDLVVFVDSAAWSARVRYAGRTVLDHLKEADSAPFERLRVRVGMPVTAPSDS